MRWEKRNEEKIGQNEPCHEESVDPIDCLRTKIDKEAKENKEGERTYPIGSCIACYPM
jgi:hypothetical protein